MRAHLGPGPLPLLAGTYAAGILAAMHVPDLASTAAVGALFPLALLGLAAARFGWRLPALLLLLGAFALAGAVRAGLAPGPGSGDGPCAAALRSHGLPGPDAAGAVRLRIDARIEGPPLFRQRGGVASAAVERAGLPRSTPQADLPADVPTPSLRIQLFLPDGLRPMSGDRLLAEAELDEAPRDGPAGPERGRQLARQGIACVARIHDGRAAVIAPAQGGLAMVEARRRTLLQAMRARLEPGPAAALVEALALGERESVDTAQAERFADSGLAHLLSVSGLHLGLTVLGFYRLLAWVLARTPLAARSDPVRLAAAFALPLAPAYALLTGASIPVLRAAIAAGLFLLAAIAGRAPHAYSALGAALLVLLAVDPAQIFDASLQLSFAACWGLLALSRPLRGLVPIPGPEPEAPWWRRAIEALLLALVTTMAATLATLPLTALHFERVSLASLPANVVAVPVGLVATVLCAIATAAGLVHESLLGIPLALASPVAGFLDLLAAHFAGWPGARLPLQAEPLSLATLTTIPLGVWLLDARPRLARLLLAGAAAALLWLQLPQAPDGRLHVEFLPVGQGDCTLLRLPDGSAILIDAGGDALSDTDVGKTRVLPQLRRRGIRRLAAVAVSHLHPDHVGGIPAVLDALEVQEFWSTGRQLEGRWGEPLGRAVEAAGIPHRLLAAGDRLELGGVRIEVVGPPNLDGLRDDPLLGDNDASLVLRIVHGDVAVLLPGDIEEIGEWALLDGGAPLQAQLLKAPHHGSRTSSTQAFVNRVRPEHVVFCVGHRNRFSFPHDDVTARYRSRGCSLHRTDQGPVHFVSDGRTIEHVP